MKTPDLLKEKDFRLIMLALLFSVIGIFYCIYVGSLTNFLLFCVFFILICLFSILYSQLKKINDNLERKENENK
jgi:uncharacterized membrane protein YfcA